MGAPEVSRRRAGLLLPLPAAWSGAVLGAALGGVLATGAVAGCGAAGLTPSPPAGSASPTVSPTVPTSPSVEPIPADGVGLVGFGIVNGPREFSVPRTAVAESIVDQANNVVLVLSAPAPAEVSGYLRRTLPGAGFMITDADPGEATFTFEGHGWRGSFTTGDGAAAILLRPR